MQQQRTGGSRRNVDQRLDDSDYNCFTIQYLGIMRVNIYFFVVILIHKPDNFSPAINVLGKNKLITAVAWHTCTVFDNANKLTFYVDSGSEITVIPLKLIKANTWFVEKLYDPTNSSNILWVPSVILNVSFRDNLFPWKFLVCKLLGQPVQSSDFMSRIS